ncbi:MAG: septal ring lytic transglycosylase RlpA family protein [Hyphomonadaceae bacterium]
MQFARWTRTAASTRRSLQFVALSVLAATAAFGAQAQTAQGGAGGGAPIVYASGIGSSYGTFLPSRTPLPTRGANLPSVAPVGPGWATPVAGAPYQIQGKWFVPAYEPEYNEVGIASWYGPNFHGKKTAVGEVYDQHALTAAHPTLPIPSTVRVTNLENGRSVLVRVNDRGPYVDDRLIDLSRGAAEALDMVAKGTARVRVEYAGPAPAQANTVPTEQMLASANGVRSGGVELGPIDPVAPQPVRVSMQVESAPLAPVSADSAFKPVYASESPASGYAPQVIPPSGQSARVSPVAQPAVDGAYRLQVGAFSDLRNARKRASEVGSVGAASVVAAEVNGVQLYRVMLGPWNDRAAAEQAKARLAASGADALLVTSR